MQIDFNIDTIASLLSFFQALLLGMFLLTHKGGNRLANVFLGVFVLSYYFGDLYDFLGAAGIVSEHHALIFFPSLTLFLYGPAIYYYVRSIVDEKFDLSTRTILLAATPGLIELIAGFILFAQPVDTKIQLMQSETFNLIHHVYTLIAGVHALFYVGLALRLVGEYRVYHRDITSVAVPKQLKWFRYFLYYFLFRFMLWVGMKVAILIVGGFTDYNLNLIFSYIIVALSISSLLVIYALSFITFKHLDVISSFFQKKRYELSQIDPEKENDFYTKIIEMIERDKKYLNPDFKITDLAEELAINSKYISQVINKNLGDNFTQLLNKYRVDEVKKKLKNPAYHHLTISAIAEECGFKSKSTFTRVFRHHTGMLPKEFKNNGSIN